MINKYNYTLNDVSYFLKGKIHNIISSVDFIYNKWMNNPVYPVKRSGVFTRLLDDGVDYNVNNDDMSDR